MKCGLVIIPLVAIVVAALAAEFWQSKPYTEWTKENIEQLTSSSPWAQTVVLRKADLVQVRREFGKISTSPSEGEGPSNPEVDYAISLRTAQPIREAVVRTAAMDQNYALMDKTAKSEFDKKWNRFLTQKFEDRIIVNVKYSSNTTTLDRQLATYWQGQTLDSLKAETYMNGPDGKRVAPIAFWVGKGASREFQFAFPRPVEAPKKASFSIEFKHPDVTDQPSSRIIARFNIKDLEYRGQVTF